MRIVEEIYDGLTDDEAFAALPARLAQVLGARACTLQIFDGLGALTRLANNYYPQEMHAFYVDAGMHRFDVWRLAAETQQVLNRACLFNEILPLDTYLRSEFYNEFYRPFGDDTAHCLGAIVRFDGGGGAWGLHRGITREPFSATDRDAMDALVPHVTQMFKLKGLLAAAGAKADTAQGLVDALPHALMVLDAAGRLLSANAAGEALLAANGPLRIAYGMVRARRAPDAARLARLIACAGSGTAERGGAVLLHREDGLSLRAVVAPWRVGERTRVLLLIDDPAALDPALAAKLAGLYDLTHAEAETVAALALGLSPAEAATARGVALPTVRSQIQQALRKSDVRTLAELVRLAASLPRMSAPPH